MGKVRSSRLRTGLRKVVGMTVTLIDAPGLPEIPIYRQVSVATGSRLIHVAGQVAWDGGDFATQVEQAYLNVGTALAAAGATFDDVVKLTAHVVDWKPALMPELLDGIARASARLGVTIAAPASLFGIVTLDVPEHLVEVEAVAVLD
jgi:enamine deaminase RidA (YjgF/YER057c/UK114 family)